MNFTPNYKSSKNNYNGSFVEAFSAHFGPGQAGLENQQQFKKYKKRKRKEPK